MRGADLSKLNTVTEARFLSFCCLLQCVSEWDSAEVHRLAVASITCVSIDGLRDPHTRCGHLCIKKIKNKACPIFSHPFAPSQGKPRKDKTLEGTNSSPPSHLIRLVSLTTRFVSRVTISRCPPHSLHDSTLKNASSGEKRSSTGRMSRLGTASVTSVPGPPWAAYS